MGNEGNFNGNNSNGRRNIGGGNNYNNPNYGKMNNGYNNNGNNYNKNDRYAKYGSGSNYNSDSYNRGNMNNHNGEYNDIPGLDEEYESLELKMDEASLEDIAAAKKADRKAKIKLGIKIASIAILSMVLIVGIFIYVKYGADIMKLRKDAIEEVNNCSKETFTKSSASKYFAKSNGKWVQMEFAASTSYKYISINDGGPSMKYACDLMFCSEDRNFYKHKGVDLMANVKAVILLIINRGDIERGGSTITQQLARNVILQDFDQNWKRKVKEIFVSLQLEKKFTKDQIMEFYLNNINFSNGYFGIESAAQGYFGKSVKNLTKDQVAYLCAIPNNPTRYNPYNYASRTINRSKLLTGEVLKYGDGRLDKAEYASIIAEADTIQVLPEKEETVSTDGKTVKIDRLLKAYIQDCALEKIISQYMEIKSEDELTDPAYKAAYLQNYENCKSRAETKLNKEGLYVYTSIDLDAQEALQKNIDTTVKALPGGKKLKKDGLTYQIQSAGVCIDNSTGCVVAMVNGRSSKAVNYLGRAYGRITTENGKTKYEWANQPGSAIKPLLVYGPAFDKRDSTTGKALYTNNTLVEDNGPVQREGVKPVKNSGGKYKGTISILEAIKGSSNVVAYKLYRDLHNEKASYAINYLKKMNFRFLTSNDKNNIGISIGGFDHGSTPLEMAAGYTTIANDGEYRRPTAVLTIKEPSTQPNPLQYDETKENGAIAKCVRVYEQSTARRLTIAMQEVLTGSHGYYSGTAYGNAVSIDCAGKTGTTNNQTDTWFCGFTKPYTTAIWIGDDDNKATKLYGSHAAKVWKGFNQALINKKKLSQEANKFNLVIMDDSEPDMTFTSEPEETTYDFTSEDPFASLAPSNAWSETFQSYSYEPYSAEPSYETWPSYEPESMQPSYDPGFGDDEEDPNNGGNNGNNNHGNNGNGNGN